MATLGSLLDAHGYLLLFAVGFVEFAGLPIASLPLLALAGSFAAQGAIGLWGAVVSAAAGGLVADAAWYGLARRPSKNLVALGLSRDETTATTRFRLPARRRALVRTA